MSQQQGIPIDRLSDTDVTGNLIQNDRVTQRHRQGLAYIYIRQSSAKQVLHNRESQANQYQLVHRAQALGWKQERIVVIDTDQGLSGQESQSRNGFQQLVAEVSLGHVGIIFGYEVSRLARNNRDWYHLLDLAAMFDTLIADNDGVYNPRHYNDRLLLGLKGTMSEAELHLLHQRLAAGRMNQVHRGEYRQLLPTGLVRLADGSVQKDPDQQVQDTIALVFAKFEQLGSCQQVLRDFSKHQLLLPRHQTAGRHAGETLWKPASEAAIYDIMRNPAYAGAFVYGRTQLDPTRRIPGRSATGRLKQPMEKWLHLQHDVYPAYITWQQYLDNQQRLHDNAQRYQQLTQPTKGPAREGACLLQGLATCGLCSHRMRVAYKSSPRYYCDALSKHLGQPGCMSLQANSIDKLIAESFFDAIRPAQLDALESVLQTQRTEHQQLALQWENQLKRARYEVQLAQRRYQAVDPENRLVAATLEANWEEKLLALKQASEDYDRFQRTEDLPQLSPELRTQFQHLSEQLPELWSQLSHRHKKQLLRTLIERVILKRRHADTVEVKIVWISGHYSVMTAHPPIWRQQDVQHYDQIVQTIKTLWQQGFDDNQIAQQLTKKGFRSARCLEVQPKTVGKIRRKHRWPHPLATHRKANTVDGQLTVRGLAKRVGVDKDWVYRQINRGIIDSKWVNRHPQTHMYLIQNHPQLISKLQGQLAKRRRASGEFRA